MPSASLHAVRATLAEAAAGVPSFPVMVPGLRSLGRGVAYTLESPALTQVRARLAGTWSDCLTLQDRQGFRPHITIQNKVTLEAARALLARLAASFVPFSIEATGLLLWHYRGGPWESAGAFPFDGTHSRT